MQYLLLIHDDEGAWSRLSEQEQAAVVQEYGAFTAELRESGSFVGANRLRPVSTASTVRVQDGQTVVTDGPFAETKEQLGGFFLIQAPSSEAACEWAAKVPAAEYGSVEVRPIWPVAAEVPAA